MATHRLFFVADNLETMKAAESELASRGIDRDQTHSLSLAPEAENPSLALHTVADLTRKDLLRSGLLGATLGAVLGIAVLGGTYALGWHTTAAGWTPFIFLAVVLLGFCTWEGGLFGIQTMHHQFTRFQQALEAGKHVFFVDVSDDERSILQNVMNQHEGLQPAGEDRGTPRWVMLGQRQLTHFLTETMP